MKKLYRGRLVFRCLVFLCCILLYFYSPDSFQVLKGFQFFKAFSPLHILWLLWLFDMKKQLVPSKNVALGSQKHFKSRFVPDESFYKAGKIVKEKEERLHDYMEEISKPAYAVFLLYALGVAGVAALYLAGVFNREMVFLVTALFYVCDLVCVVIWCPFRTFMGNRCCTVCRIYNWDHLMMFAPFLIIPSFYTTSLLLLSILVFLFWETQVRIHPERFYEGSNKALRCIECTDRLCKKPRN
ncbi:MAG: hypothetical protein IJU50_08685 [Lachnospiraceae bacterium]|nr:hypothetical protein [Lachnospiraceae bacterium]